MLFQMAECLPVVDKKRAWVPKERTRRGGTLVKHPETLVQGCTLGLASTMSRKGKLGAGSLVELLRLLIELFKASLNCAAKSGFGLLY